MDIFCALITKCTLDINACAHSTNVEWIQTSYSSACNQYLHHLENGEFCYETNNDKNHYCVSVNKKKMNEKCKQKQIDSSDYGYDFVQNENGFVVDTR